MIRKTITIFFVPFIFFFACAPNMKKPVEPIRQVESGTSLPIEKGLIDRKIDFLDDILAKEQLSDEDRDIALQLLDSYNLLKKSSAGRVVEQQLEELVLSLSEALSKMDERFFSREESLILFRREIATRLYTERNRIMGLYRDGNYAGVIRDCLRLRSEFGSDAVSLELGLVFALSLGEEGKLQEAIQLGEGIARQLKKSPDLTLLRSRIGRWQIILGKRNDAVVTYEKLVADLEETSALAETLKTEINKDVFPENGANEMKNGFLEEPASAIKDEGKTAEQIIEVSRFLIRENRYDEARQLLLKKRENVEPGAEWERVESALVEVEEAREKFEEEKAIREAYLKSTLAAVRDLIEADQFEEAIRKLATITQVQDENAEAALLRERAVAGIINRDRNKAAQLFLSARKSADPSRKEALLKSALQILEYLLENYPSSDLKDKVLSNKSRVEDELKRLDESP